jgi:hypothetical protein
MDKENVVYIHNGVLLINKEEWNYDIFRIIYGTENHHVKWNKPDSEVQIPHVFCHVQTWALKKQDKKAEES